MAHGLLGRPTKYTKETAERVCTMLAGGMVLKQIVKVPGIPSLPTLMRWFGQNAEFRENYLKGMEARGCLHADQVVAISIGVMRGEIDPRAGAVAITGLTWAAGKMAPKIFGNKIELTGKDGKDLIPPDQFDWSKFTDDELVQMKALVRKGTTLALPAPNGSPGFGGIPPVADGDGDRRPTSTQVN